MAEPTVIHHTFVLERRFPKPPQRVFEAFSEPDLKRRWFAEGLGHDLVAYELDFRAGGAERVRYRLGAHTPFPGAMIASDGRILEITPEQRIVWASVMSLEGRTFSAELVTIQLKAAGRGTDLVCTFQGAFFEGADGPQMREGGWHALFDQLAKVVAA